MKVIRTIEVFNDNDKKLNIGDIVTVETIEGKIYKGTIKAFNPNNIAIDFKDGNGCSILYKSIKSVI